MTAGVAAAHECPPVTRTMVTGAGASAYTLTVSATNTCNCRIYFRACSQNRPRCTGGLIKAGETRQFKIVTPASDGKANFNWRCR